jgi:hypothetical protein
MSDRPPQTPTASNPKVRPDDARGAKPGTGTVTPPHGGRIGQAPYIPSEEQRKKVRDYAKTFPLHGEHLIARLVGISTSTLRRHHADDMELGRAEMLAAVGAQVINRAINVDAVGADGKPIAKGDLDAQKFILARLGGWTTKIDAGPKASEPFGGSVDLSRLSPADLKNYGRLSAIAEGLDPDDITGEP